jgi:NADH-quinone oxidoreductase subunit K
MVFHPWMLLAVGTAMFAIGIVGVVVRRNLLVILMCIELMLNAANICFVAFSRMHQNLNGDLVAVFVMTVAAAESAVGLGLVIALYRTLKTVESEKLQLLRD